MCLGLFTSCAPTKHVPFVFCSLSLWSKLHSTEIIVIALRKFLATVLGSARFQTNMNKMIYWWRKYVCEWSSEPQKHAASMNITILFILCQTHNNNKNFAIFIQCPCITTSVMCGKCQWRCELFRFQSRNCAFFAHSLLLLELLWQVRVADNILLSRTHTHAHKRFGWLVVTGSWEWIHTPADWAPGFFFTF